MSELPFDAGSWSNHRIEQEIAAMLPSGWSFGFYQDPDLVDWVFRFESTGGKVEWWDRNPALNLLLLSALGWLHLRDSKKVKHSPWVRRRETAHRPTRFERAQATVSDPPDLDPAEIEAVYCRHARK